MAVTKQQATSSGMKYYKNRVPVMVHVGDIQSGCKAGNIFAAGGRSKDQTMMLVDEYLYELDNPAFFETVEELATMEELQELSDDVKTWRIQLDVTCSERRAASIRSSVQELVRELLIG